MSPSGTSSTGPVTDPRRFPFRPDLAADWLRGRVSAARFVPGQARQVAVGTADLKAVADRNAALASQLRYGETFTVYEERGGWAWGQNSADGYVGYVDARTLKPEASAPTHRLWAVRSFRHPEPDLKSPPVDWLSLASTVTVIEHRHGFAGLADGTWVFDRHLVPCDLVEPDVLATARRLLNVPYLWGGRTSLGIDCSGLVQIALDLAGIPCPRDSDMQAAELGVAVAPVRGGAVPRRSDLVFFAGHVGLMSDDQHLLHANAFSMSVTIEALADVAARAGSITAIRRLPK